MIRLWVVIAALAVIACAGAAWAQLPAGEGPWNRDLLILESADGLRFENARTFVERGGVPSLIRDGQGRLIAAFQWFPFEHQDAFDRIAVAFSTDEGKSWTKPQTITIDGLPEGCERACDPTLALLDDGRIRLYFTSDPHDGAGAGTYSAISKDAVRYEFEPNPRFRAPGENVLDCAVVRIGKQWHYYAPKPGQPGRGYHAVSDDGLRFTGQPDVSLRDFGSWLGCAVPADGGVRFYGTGDGIRSTRSTDGAVWETEDGVRAQGGDPGVVRTGDGRWLMIVTGPLRPDAMGTVLGSGAAMWGDGEHLYILRGAILYKLDTKDLRVIDSRRLSELPADGGDKRGP
jgi:hypothetical protein